MGSPKRAAVAASIGILFAPAALAQSWSVSEEESVSLELSKPDKSESLMSISCDSGQSSVVVPVPAPGHKEQQTPFAIALTEQDGAVRRLTLRPDVCGGETTCTDRKDGMVASYEFAAKGRAEALRIGEKTKTLSVKLPDVAIDVAADEKEFAKFTQLCKTWR